MNSALNTKYSIIESYSKLYWARESVTESSVRSGYYTREIYCTYEVLPISSLLSTVLVSYLRCWMLNLFRTSARSSVQNCGFPKDPPHSERRGPSPEAAFGDPFTAPPARTRTPAPERQAATAPITFLTPGRTVQWVQYTYSLYKYDNLIRSTSICTVQVKIIWLSILFYVFLYIKYN